MKLTLLSLTLLLLLLSFSLGPAPVRMDQLTFSLVQQAFAVLLRKETNESTRVMSKTLKAEDGAQEAVHAFYRHLPLEAMLCDVSLFQG